MAGQTQAAQAEAASQAPEVLYATGDHVATITLNRPERMNTISGPMLRQLTERLLEADADRDVRVVVLTGTGRAFCAGLDLTEVDRGRASAGGISSADAGDSTTSTCATRRRPCSSTSASRPSAP